MQILVLDKRQSMCWQLLLQHCWEKGQVLGKLSKYNYTLVILKNLTKDCCIDLRHVNIPELEWPLAVRKAHQKVAFPISKWKCTLVSNLQQNFPSQVETPFISVIINVVLSCITMTIMLVNPSLRKQTEKMCLLFPNSIHIYERKRWLPWV